jgi:predicted aspartyl protease
MDLSQTLPIVEVRIGDKPYRFAVDTGAVGHGRISPALAQSLGLAAAGEAVAADGSGRTQARRTYRLDAIDVGGVRFSALEFSELERLPPGVDGILGLGLFASHLVTFDYPKGTLSLSRQSLPETAMGYTPQPGRGIAVPVSIGDERIMASIDTGNAVAALILPTALAERLPRKGEPRIAGRASTAISTVEIMEVEITVPVRVGGSTLPVTKVSYPSLGETGNIGSRGLSSTILRIDQVNRRLEIVPVDSGERG